MGRMRYSGLCLKVINEMGSARENLNEECFVSKEITESSNDNAYYGNACQ